MTLYKELPHLFSEGMYAPFAERKENVVQIELTEGCSHNKCTFCDMYKTRSREKSQEEGISHINSVFDTIPKNRLKNLERIWIANGDVLNMNPAKLNYLIQHATNRFYEKVGKFPRRTALFANTKNILGHTYNELKALNCGGSCWNEKGFGSCSITRLGDDRKHGLETIYWGVESGSSKVLEYVKKGCDQDQILMASSVLGMADIDKSVMIITGLGGIKYAQDHLEETTYVLNKIQPKFITFIGITTSSNSLYAKKMENEMKENRNRPLTERELATQTLDIISGLRINSKIGCFDNSMQTFGRNPLPFGNIDFNPKLNENFISEQKIKLRNTKFSDEKLFSGNKGDSKNPLKNNFYV